MHGNPNGPRDASIVVAPALPFPPEILYEAPSQRRPRPLTALAYPNVELLIDGVWRPGAQG